MDVAKKSERKCVCVCVEEREREVVVKRAYVAYICLEMKKSVK